MVEVERKKKQLNVAALELVFVNITINKYNS